MATDEPGDDGDRALVEQAVAGMTDAMATVIARAWVISPSSTLLALSRALGALCLRYLDAHPSDRANVLTMLRSLVGSVDIETASSTRTH